jgi:hypothetical protein
VSIVEDEEDTVVVKRTNCTNIRNVGMDASKTREIHSSRGDGGKEGNSGPSQGGSKVGHMNFAIHRWFLFEQEVDTKLDTRISCTSVIMFCYAWACSYPSHYRRCQGMWQRLPKTSY